jgi:hypothetical protein
MLLLNISFKKGNVLIFAGQKAVSQPEAMGKMRKLMPGRSHPLAK